MLANFKDKRHLDALVLEWDDDMNGPRDENIETYVLDVLQSHKNLKKLTIKNYCGSQFPTWIGGPTLTNMVFLILSGCKNCKSLPALGQLSSLEDLTIEGMEGIKSVGPEFYRGSSSSVKPFQSLKTLKFKEMVQWEEWSSLSMGENEEFPSLRELLIQNCPKLGGQLPEFLPLLVTLEIRSCRELAAIPKLPLLCKIVLDDCHEMMVKTLTDLSSLASLHICKISNLSCLPEEVLQQFTALEALEITDCEHLTSLSNKFGLQHLVSLQSLLVENCPQLVSLLAEGGEWLLPQRLKYLKLTKCQNLEKLPDKLSSLTSLEKMSIHQCPRLLYFPRMGLPSMLKLLDIKECSALESLPNGMIHKSLSIEFLKIERCSSLTSFPSGELPSTVRNVEILDCKNFVLPAYQMIHNLPSLESLSVSGCCSLTSFPTDGLSLPSTIIAASKKQLDIVDCENLESLLEVQHNLVSLRELSIRSCPRLLSVFGGGFPFANLSLLEISACKSLKSVPGCMSHLTYLVSFTISNCPNLVSLPSGGLPINLKSLRIEGCENLKNPFELGLHKLNSLKVFTIGGCPGLISCLEDGLLPTTLANLHFTGFPNLTSLDTALQNLDSLCSLTISECDNLMCLPEEGLPASLSYLTIWFCPLLQRRCKGNGKDWDKISHIPYINIDQEISFR